MDSLYSCKLIHIITGGGIRTQGQNYSRESTRPRARCYTRTFLSCVLLYTEQQTIKRLHERGFCQTLTQSYLCSLSRGTTTYCTSGHDTNERISKQPIYDTHHRVAKTLRPSRTPTQQLNTLHTHKTGTGTKAQAQQASRGLA